MFGRVRASPSSLESFETPPSKIIKDDSLSIYETTLMKLKMGSQRHLNPPPTAADSTDCSSQIVPSDTNSAGDSMVIDPDRSSCSSDCQSTGNLNSQQRSKSTSILHLFSKFKSNQRTPTSISDQTRMMMIEISGSVSFSSSFEFQTLSGEKYEGSHELNAEMES